jgi:exonuclease SbcC
VRPLRVTVQAFGPYAGEQTLDFAELRGAGFFLITGPTGSGKTTVLDAMSFALYGVTSGGPENEGGRSGASMRSDHADPELLTRVCFDFALGDDEYRIEREPEQERPKLKGEGTTRHAQGATLWRLRSGEGVPEVDGAPLATGWTRVSAASEELLGFRSEQFRQVVMLPQGRFQKLLEADSREREQILRALFDTGHYNAVELALKEAAKGLRDAAAANAVRRAEALRQAEVETAEDLAERCARLSLDAAEAAVHATEAESARDAAQELLQRGRDAAAKLADLAGAETAVASLAADDERIGAA